MTKSRYEHLEKLEVQISAQWGSRPDSIPLGILDAWDQSVHTVESPKEKACRMLGECWARSKYQSLDGFLLHLGVSMISNPDVIISACKKFISSPPLTTEQKLARLTLAAEDVELADASSNVDDYEAAITYLRKVLRGNE